MSLNWKVTPPKYIYCTHASKCIDNKKSCVGGSPCSNGHPKLSCSWVYWKCLENYNKEECVSCEDKFRCAFGLI